MPGKFFVQNFGCRATQADGACIERSLAQRGLQAAISAGEADWVVLNTCTVTAAADADARAAIRRIHRENPGCRILVTGCYAQRAPQEIASLAGVDGVIGNSHKHQIADVIARPPKDFFPLKSLKPPAGAGSGPSVHSPVLVGDIFVHTDFAHTDFAHTNFLAAPVFDADTAAGSARTRPNLKVQDGCDNRCSFCIIPSVRGNSRSLPPAEVLREVEALVRAGYREMVISGINLGRWGHDLAPSSTFEKLLHSILERTAIEKIRISSVEPMDWSSELIDLVSSHPRIARHAHVPLHHWCRRYGRLSRRDQRIVRRESQLYRLASLHLSAHLYLFRAPRDSGGDHTQPGSTAGGPRAAQDFARPDCRKEPRLPPVVCWRPPERDYALNPKRR